MKVFKGSFIAVITVFLALQNMSAVTVKEILTKLDTMQTLKSDISSKVKLTQERVGKGVKEIESYFYRRDRDDAFLIILTAPDVEKGNGYLRMGDDFWMYKRNTRTFQHVNRDENISGTDARGGDFEKRKLSELYKAAVDSSGKEMLFEEMLGKIPVYRFEITAVVNDVTYPKQVYWVRKDNFLPLKVQSYSLSGTLMQTAYYRKYTEIEGRYFMVQGLFIDEFEKGNKTIMEMTGISLSKLSDNIFTKAYLESLSK